ncbi:UDP-N-acetylglucosamine 1-carboxyvinyltransferase [unidentified eubacterium SCB49]|nr:UDP-N-acetylglucosamine 1-carboxyvinyltransferase [unidentified eubacterium SCB49]
MKKILSLSLLSLLTFNVLAQSNTENNNSIKNQFIDVVDGSNSYQEFKVIPKSKLIVLRKNVSDSIDKLEQTILASQNKIDEQKAQISQLENTLSNTNADLAVSKEKEDGISFFGSLVKKATYNTIMWSIIGGLILALAFFIFKFKNSNAITKEANIKLAETESEFEAHRSKKLEEIQQIRRKLQDEINKNR